MEKLFAAVFHQGTLLAELLREHVAPVPLGPQGAVSADWQAIMLSIAASEEVGEQKLAFPSKDVELDSTSPVVKLSLSAQLLPLIKRATAVLQVLWSTQGETRQSIFHEESSTSPVPPDFLFEVQSSWGHLATAQAVSQSVETLYRVHDAEELGFAQFPLVQASIAALVQAPNLALLSKDIICSIKQCRVSEVILKRCLFSQYVHRRAGQL
ncbi:UNVERIFIED_CONTAM: hypothetical protein FKN15_057298 [Acipenser sinensis]